MTLRPSSGTAPEPEEVNVPSVTGQTYAEAASTLSNADLGIDGDDCEDGDTVSGQSPNGGKVPPGTTISVVCE